MTVSLPDLTTHQTFVVTERLSVPAILGCDLLVRHGPVIDFEKGTYHGKGPSSKGGKLSLRVSNSCMQSLVLDEDCPQEIPFKDRAIGQINLEMPTDSHLALSSVLQEHDQAFQETFGKH